MKKIPSPAFCGSLLLMIMPDAAWAYMGPGVGIGAIGTTLGVIGALLLGLVAVVWYPLKRLFRRVRGQPASRGTRPARGAARKR